MAKKELEILLKATKISKSFGDFVANQNIDISIAKGQIHALLGENGAGKSTLVKIFYGVLQPDSGSIEINNQKVSITSPNVARKNGIGMVFQHFSLFPALTVAENILIALDKKIKFNKVVNEITKLSKEWDIDLDNLQAGAPAQASAPAEAKATATVTLKSFGDKKINVLKAVKEIMGLGLMEAKNFVEGLPKPVVEEVDKEEAEKIKKQLEDAGGTVEVK